MRGVGGHDAGRLRDGCGACALNLKQWAHDGGTAPDKFSGGFSDGFSGEFSGDAFRACEGQRGELYSIVTSGGGENFQ